MTRFFPIRAVRHLAFDIIRLLVEKRADVDAKNGLGQTPLHLACEGNRSDIVQVLLDADADVNLGDMVGDAPIHTACKVRANSLISAKPTHSNF